MRFEQLDLNLLVALDILLQEKNITRSAERLHLSQSATSGVLSRLRAYFEDDLLVQIGKKMHPTPFALELQGPVAGVLATIRGSIIGRKTSNPEESERHFKIIASDYIIQSLLRHMLAKLAVIAPNITFEFLSPFAHDVSILTKGGADLMVAPESVMVDNYPNQPLIKDEMVCVADINNEHIHGTLTEEQYASFGHVSVGIAKTSMLSIEKWLFDKMEANRKVEIITNDFSTILYSLMNTNRIAILPKLFVEAHAKEKLVKIVKLPFDVPPLRESMMWPPTLDNDPVHRWLRQHIVDCAAPFNPS